MCVGENLRGESIIHTPCPELGFEKLRSHDVTAGDDNFVVFAHPITDGYLGDILGDGIGEAHPGRGIEGVGFLDKHERDIVDPLDGGGGNGERRMCLVEFDFRLPKQSLPK